MNELIQQRINDIIDICREHHVISISLFGSAATNSFDEESDIDLLVEFSPEVDVLEYADNYFSLLDHLESLLNRKVDLLSVRSIKNQVLKQEIYQSKIDLYAAQIT